MDVFRQEMFRKGGNAGPRDVRYEIPKAADSPNETVPAPFPVPPFSKRMARRAFADIVRECQEELRSLELGIEEAAVMEPGNAGDLRLPYNRFVWANHCLWQGFVFGLPLETTVSQFEGKHVGLIGPSRLWKSGIGKGPSGSLVEYAPLKTTIIEWTSEMSLHSLIALGSQLKDVMQVC
jgi:hypothetical protein